MRGGWGGMASLGEGVGGSGGNRFFLFLGYVCNYIRNAHRSAEGSGERETQLLLPVLHSRSACRSKKSRCPRQTRVELEWSSSCPSCPSDGSCW